MLNIKRVFGYALLLMGVNGLQAGANSSRDVNLDFWCADLGLAATRIPGLCQAFSATKATLYPGSNTDTGVKTYSYNFLTSITGNNYYLSNDDTTSTLANIVCVKPTYAVTYLANLKKAAATRKYDIAYAYQAKEWVESSNAPANTAICFILYPQGSTSRGIDLKAIANNTTTFSAIPYVTPSASTK